jgi:hypothetical protein
MVDDAAGNRRLIINHVMLDELLAGPDQLDAEIGARAGAAQRLYRQRSGPGSAIMLDFPIGAHASTTKVPLSTRGLQQAASYSEHALIAFQDQQ